MDSRPSAMLNFYPSAKATTPAQQWLGQYSCFPHLTVRAPTENDDGATGVSSQYCYGSTIVPSR